MAESISFEQRCNIKKNLQAFLARKNITASKVYNRPKHGGKVTWDAMMTPHQPWSPRSTTLLTFARLCGLRVNEFLEDNEATIMARRGPGRRKVEALPAPSATHAVSELPAVMPEPTTTPLGLTWGISSPESNLNFSVSEDRFKFSQNGVQMEGRLETLPSMCFTMPSGLRVMVLPPVA